MNYLPRGVDSFFVLIVIAIILGNDRLECNDCAFNHIVGGLLYGKPLQPHAGRRDYACKEIVVSARKLNKLVSDTHCEGKQAELDN